MSTRKELLGGRVRSMDDGRVPARSTEKGGRRLASSNMTSDEKVDAVENERRRVMGSWTSSRTTFKVRERERERKR